MMAWEFLDQAGGSRKLISGEGVRNDEDSAVRTLVVEESNREWRRPVYFQVRSCKILGRAGPEGLFLIDKQLIINR